MSLYARFNLIDLCPFRLPCRGSSWYPLIILVAMIPSSYEVYPINNRIFYMARHSFKLFFKCFCYKYMLQSHGLVSTVESSTHQPISFALLRVSFSKITHTGKETMQLLTAQILALHRAGQRKHLHHLTQVFASLFADSCVICRKHSRYSNANHQLSNTQSHYRKGLKTSANNGCY